MLHRAGVIDEPIFSSKCHRSGLGLWLGLRSARWTATYYINTGLICACFRTRSLYQRMMKNESRSSRRRKSISVNADHPAAYLFPTSVSTLTLLTYLCSMVFMLNH